MFNLKTAFASFLLAAAISSPANATTDPVSAPSSTPETKLDEIKLSLFSHRRTPNLYWRIDSSGKGEVSTPEAVGYQAQSPLIVSPVFRIASGVHRIDIGEAGYVELRTYLRQIIESTPDRYKMTDGACVLKTVTRSGNIELNWTGKISGEFSLPHDCLNGAGQYFHNHMLLAWHALARNLHASNNSIITVEMRPEVRVPKQLSFTKQNIWTGNVTSWSIGSSGRGWIELKQDGHLSTLDISQSNHVKAGRYNFQLDRTFHQSVLRELDPYLSGLKTNGSCEDEIDMSDQPIVRLEWTNKAGRPAKFVSDLGCPSFAARFNKVEFAFGELFRNGQLGGSNLLRSK